MHVGHEQVFARDGDVGGSRGAWLALTRQGNDPRLLERLRGQHCIPADRAMLAAKRKEEGEEMTRRRDRAKRLVVALDVFLQQHDVVTGSGARQAAGCEIVHKLREFALARVHVPGGDGEGDRSPRGRWSNDLRPYAGRRNEKDNDEPERLASPVSYVAGAVLALVAAASVAADRSIVTEV